MEIVKIFWSTAIILNHWVSLFIIVNNPENFYLIQLGLDCNWLEVELL
jgi:hypothetical protein